MNKVFIGTPCYGNMLTADYFKSCLQLTALAATKNVPVAAASNAAYFAAALIAFFLFS